MRSFSIPVLLRRIWELTAGFGVKSMLFATSGAGGVNWPTCEPMKVCKHLVTTCSNKCSCQIPQPGLLLDVLLPTGPQEPLGFGGEDNSSFSPCSSSRAVLGRVPWPQTPGWVLGGSGPCCWYQGGPAPAQGLRWSCPVPSTGPSVGWDRPHSGSKPGFARPAPRTFQQRCHRSHCHSGACCNFLFFQFLNYIDYHIKHSWCYRNSLKIIRLYLPDTNETHLYY